MRDDPRRRRDERDRRLHRPPAGTSTRPLERLDRWVPFEAAWLALSDPRSNVYATVGSTGLDRSVIDYLDRPAVAQEIQLTGLDQQPAAGQRGGPPGPR